MTLYLNLFYLFFRIGLFGFGGGYAMLPLIYQGIEKFGIMSSAEFSRLVALSQVTPGPIAINAATYVGFLSGGVSGASVATIGVTLPSVLLVGLVFHFMKKFQESKGLQAAFEGIRPATTGLLASAVIFLAEESIFNEGILSSAFFKDPFAYLNLIPIGIFAVVLVLNLKFKMGPILLTVLAGAAGAVLCC